MNADNTFTHSIVEGRRCKGMVDGYTYVYAISAYYQVSIHQLRDSVFQRLRCLSLGIYIGFLQFTITTRLPD